MRIGQKDGVKDNKESLLNQEDVNEHDLLEQACDNYFILKVDEKPINKEYNFGHHLANQPKDKRFIIWSVVFAV